MNQKIKYGLLVLAEELGEMQKEVIKAIRFGLDSTDPKTGVTNYTAMVEEFNDIIGTLEFLSITTAEVTYETKKSTPATPIATNLVSKINWDSVYRKVDKIEHYFKYSEQRGLL